MHENDSDPQYDKEIEDCLKKLEKLSKIEYLHPEAKSAVAKELRKDYHNIDELHELINRINDWLKRYELWKKQEESPQEKEIKNDQEDIRFADFIAWEKSSRDTIDLKRVYVDIAGDLVAGVLLSQIIYWWYIPGKDGKTKLRVKKNGKYYLVKNLDEWWNECRIKKDTAKRKLKHLENKGLIVIENHFFNGKKTNYITLNKSNFLKAIREYSEKSQRAIEENSIGAICTNHNKDYIKDY